MTSKNEVGVTVIGHNSESRTKVNGYEQRGSYRKEITYDVTIEQIVAVINESRYCEQFIKYECHGSLMSDAWWVSRQGNVKYGFIKKGYGKMFLLIHLKELLKLYAHVLYRLFASCLFFEIF